MAEQFLISLYNRNEEGSPRDPFMHSVEVIEELQEDWGGHVYHLITMPEWNRVTLLYSFPDESIIEVQRTRADEKMGAFNSFRLVA